MSENLEQQMKTIGLKAKAAARRLALVSEQSKYDALHYTSDYLLKHQNVIIAANEIDMNGAHKKGLSQAMLDRLELNKTRIEGMAKSLIDIANMDNPVGVIEKEWTQPNGLRFQKSASQLGLSV